jgi:hypothetical protein
MLIFRIRLSISLFFRTFARFITAFGRNLIINK